MVFYFLRSQPRITKDLKNTFGFISGVIWTEAGMRERPEMRAAKTGPGAKRKPREVAWA